MVADGTVAAGLGVAETGVGGAADAAADVAVIADVEAGADVVVAVSAVQEAAECLPAEVVSA